MDTVVFSAVFILVMLAAFVLAIIAVATEERRQRRAEEALYALAPTQRTGPPVASATNTSAPSLTADARPARFVLAP